MSSNKDFDLRQLLPTIPPASLNYTEWLAVGMALKAEGYAFTDWEEWSKGDSRFVYGECERKWNGFEGEGITGATITQMAKDHGWEPKARERDVSEIRTFDWGDEIGKAKVVVDKAMIDQQKVPPPSENWNGTDDLLRYIQAIFNADDEVGFVVESFQNDKGKFTPKNAGVSKKAAELIRTLQKYREDITDSVGTYNTLAGAWIRFNPLDGEGFANKNVVDFRYALIESDDIGIDEQYTLLTELQLPIAALVHSGSKSLHAIVKIFATSSKEYSDRVNFLYEVCRKNGFKIDTQNKNPSRLSRMPGVIRGEKRQYLIATNIGLGSWEEWVEHIKMFDNDLPEPEQITLEDMTGTIELPEEMIEGVLRRGRKMVVASASKAGKTFSMIELALAISSGTKWLGWKCTAGSVLYADFELGKNFFKTRLQAVCNGLKLPPSAGLKIYHQDLRGQAASIDRLVDKVIYKAKKIPDLAAIIIDPIYKIISGDENNASDMANFMNQFDRIARETNSSVICVHHYSKGNAGEKRAMDRASGSGVFARDPDALVSMTEIDLTDEIKAQLRNKVICRELYQYWDGTRPSWRNTVPEHELGNAQVLIRHAETWEEKAAIQKLINRSEDEVESMIAIRVEGTLRDYPRFKPFNCWFSYPCHFMDDDGILDQACLVGEVPAYQKGGEKAKEVYKAEKNNKDLRMFDCFRHCQAEFGEVTTKELLESVNDSLAEAGKKSITDDTLKNWLKVSRYLETISRGKGKDGKQLPSIVRIKGANEEYSTDFPPGFMDD